MYSTYIENLPDSLEEDIKAAEHIDILTFNRITDYNKLTDYQKRTIAKVHSRLTAFESENKELIETYLDSYSINGVSMSFGKSWNLKVISGVAIPGELYRMLMSTGLCYSAI